MTEIDTLFALATHFTRSSHPLHAILCYEAACGCRALNPQQEVCSSLPPAPAPAPSPSPCPSRRARYTSSTSSRYPTQIYICILDESNPSRHVLYLFFHAPHQPSPSLPHRPPSFVLPPYSVSLSPSSQARARVSLAHLLLTHTHNVLEAKNHLERANVLCLGRAVPLVTQCRVRATLAFSHLTLGHPLAALDAYEKAIDICRKRHPTLHDPTAARTSTATRGYECDGQTQGTSGCPVQL